MKKNITFYLGFFGSFNAGVNEKKLLGYLNPTDWFNYACSWKPVDGNLRYALEASGLETIEYEAMATSCFVDNTCVLCIRLFKNILTIKN